MDFDLKQFAALLLKRWWIILLCALLCAGLLYAYTVLYVTPTYATSTMLMVTSQHGGVAGIAAAENFVPTYSTLLRNSSILAETAASLGLDEGVTYTAGQLAGMISVSHVPDTSIFYITVVCANQAHAPIIANKVAEIALPYAVDISEGNSVKVVQKATGAYQSSPNIRNNVIIGFGAGFVLAAAFLILIEVLDTAIKSGDDLKEIAGEIPVIGTIPSIDIPTVASVRHDKKPA